MRYAVIADIHANLLALRVVLEDIKAQQCSRIVCLGDLVGYNSYPKECLDIIRELDIPCVKGNHDEYCSSDVPLEGFNPRATEAVQWTREQLSEGDRKWLGELPYVKLISGFTIVHATLNEPHRWSYVFDTMAAAAHFEHQTTSVCFFGHTHVPLAFVRDSAVRGGTYTKFRIEAGKKHFVNVGSVGQPRDNNPKAAYVVYDLDEGSIELRRLDYPKSDEGGSKGPSLVKNPPRSGPPFLSAANQNEAE